MTSKRPRVPISYHVVEEQLGKDKPEEALATAAQRGGKLLEDEKLALDLSRKVYDRPGVGPLQIRQVAPGD